MRQAPVEIISKLAFALPTKRFCISVIPSSSSPAVAHVPTVLKPTAPSSPLAVPLG